MLNVTPIEEFGLGVELPFPKSITNDEVMECCDFVEVMKFMREQSAPVPVSNEELGPLLRAWVKYKRAELKAQVIKILKQRREEQDAKSTSPTAKL